MSLTDHIDGIEKKVDQATKEGLRDAGQLLLRALSEQLAPHRKTGRLEDSLSVEVRPDGVSVVSDAPYALYLDRQIGYIDAALNAVSDQIPTEIMKGID